VGEPRAGVRLWNPGKDFRSFLELRRRGELSTAGWVRSVARPQHFPLFRWDDPRPSVAVQAKRVAKVVGRRSRRVVPAAVSADGAPVLPVVVRGEAVASRAHAG
jgi:hypothetical protein